VFKLFSRKDAFKATVNDLGKPIEVEPSSNLLQAALAAGVAWPHSCRVGSCGTCRCRLVSGRIKELSDFSYVLEEDELDRGMILACQTSLRSDIVVEVDLDTTVGKVAKPESIKGVISGSTPLTHDILEIRVHLEKPLPRYIAGQYAEISVAGIDHPRSYSFARAPENEKSDDVTFHVRHVPGGEMSGWLHAESRIGQEVVITGPFGSFHLRDSQSPILCIAGGSGMAPIKALLECLCTSGFKRQVTYLFGARTQKDLYCLDEMDAVKAKGNDHFRFLPILSNVWFSAVANSLFSEFSLSGRFITSSATPFSMVSSSAGPAGEVTGGLLIRSSAMISEWFRVPNSSNFSDHRCQLPEVRQAILWLLHMLGIRGRQNIDFRAVQQILLQSQFRAALRKLFIHALPIKRDHMRQVFAQLL